MRKDITQKRLGRASTGQHKRTNEKENRESSQVQRTGDTKRQVVVRRRAHPQKERSGLSSDILSTVLIEHSNRLVDLVVQRIVGLEQAHQFFLFHFKKHTRNLGSEVTLSPVKMKIWGQLSKTLKLRHKTYSNIFT